MFLDASQSKRTAPTQFFGQMLCTYVCMITPLSICYDNYDPITVLSFHCDRMCMFFGQVKLKFHIYLI